MRGPHDVAGLPAGMVDTSPHDPTFWDKQIDGLFMVLVGKGLSRADEMRRGVENLGHDAYARLTYYEKWCAALTRNLVDKGILSQDQIDAQVRAIRQRPAETGELEPKPPAGQ